MLELLSRCRTVALRRLGTHLPHTLAFGLIGAVTEILNQMPDWMNRIDQHGMDVFLARLPRGVAATVAATLILVLLLRLSMDRASDLLRRPVRFLLLLSGGSAGAALIAWCIHFVFSNGRIATVMQRPDRLFENWTLAMLWGGLIGWLYLLSLQRAEDRAKLAALLGRRALLARQLAQARLGAARAQIDPSMVAQVLSQVRARYRTDPPAASAQLDQLISQLRRALNRVKRESPPYGPDTHE